MLKYYLFEEELFWSFSGNKILNSFKYLWPSDEFLFSSLMCSYNAMAHNWNLFMHWFWNRWITRFYIQILDWRESYGSFICAWTRQYCCNNYSWQDVDWLWFFLQLVRTLDYLREPERLCTWISFYVYFSRSVVLLAIVASCFSFINLIRDLLKYKLNAWLISAPSYINIVPVTLAINSIVILFRVNWWIIMVLISFSIGRVICLQFQMVRGNERFRVILLLVSVVRGVRRYQIVYGNCFLR